MGQKTNPLSFRGKYTNRWNLSNRTSNLIHEDIAIREVLEGLLDDQFIIGGIEIVRELNRLKIRIYFANRIRRKFKGRLVVDQLRKLTGYDSINILFIHNSGLRRKFLRKIHRPFRSYFPMKLDALLVAQIMGEMIKNGKSVNQMQREVLRIYKLSSVRGIKVDLAGRFFGNSMAKRRTFKKGVISLQSIRAHLDYGAISVPTTSGLFGIKVWINNNEQHTKEN